DVVGKGATAIAAIGVVCNTVALGLRWKLTGHVPFTNMYEYSTSFAWGIVLVYLFGEQRYNLRVAGAFVMPIAFVLNASTLMLRLPTDPGNLPPALQSNWLTFHVLTAILAYAAYAFSCGLAVMYLWKESLEATKSKSFFNKELPPAVKLDELSYRFIAFAFPFISMVIISGAIWAEYAWGRYWSWDPKETWSLITWLVYAAYLHARFTYGWKGRRAAWMAIFGFATVLFTYYGVNLFLPGLHSYGSQ
ncbi:MAG TPA: c-type cytochrome biogenesis protein CcsB, partial [Bacillota bacterium]|nr:c-type cytochrome biogenesis protein CcsB [Bacillota bacterium]